MMADVLPVIPNFFIVGAPRCGTTSLYEYLRQHPEVFMPDFKEPHFFGKDLHWERIDLMDSNIYQRLFFQSNNYLAKGEASVYYLYSISAPFEIKKYNPYSKIIILLRNPVDLIYSLHSQYVFSGNENLVDFKEALNAEEKRKLGQNLPPYIDMMEKVFYKSYIHRLPKQIKSYQRLFSKNVLILLLEDLKVNVEETYMSVLRFLSVDTAFRPDFIVQNPNKIPKSNFIKNMIKKYGIKLGKLRKYISKYPFGITKTIEGWNTEIINRKPMSTELKTQLQNEFLPVIEELEIILQKDLSGWKK